MGRAQTWEQSILPSWWSKWTRCDHSLVISSVPYGTRSRAAKPSHDCRRTFTDFESNVIPICRTVSVRYGCICTSVALPMVFTGWGGKVEAMLSTVWVDVSKLYTVRAK